MSYLRHLMLTALFVLMIFPAMRTEAAGRQATESNAEPAAQQTPKTPQPEDPNQVVTPSETASTPLTIRTILTNFESDQKAIWTSPFRVNHENAKWWVIFSLGTAALVGTDRTAEKAIPPSVAHAGYSTQVSQIGQEYVTLPIAAGFYWYGRAGNHPKSREVGVLSAQALLDSGILVTILKVASGRERPNVAGGNGRFFKGKGFNSGFPSGHSIEVWTFASVISHEYGPGHLVPIISYGLAAAVSAARFTGQYHYPSDILAGGSMGWFVGTYVWNHHQDPALHKRYGTIGVLLPTSVNPIIAPKQHVRGIQLGWVK